MRLMIATVAHLTVIFLLGVSAVHSRLLQCTREFELISGPITQVNGLRTGWIASKSDANGFYLGNQTCTAAIRGRSGFTVGIKFTKMDLEDCDNCECDYLSLRMYPYDRGNQTIPIILPSSLALTLGVMSGICGTKPSRLAVATISQPFWTPYVDISFYTNHKVQRTGFNLTWTEVNDPDYVPCRNFHQGYDLFILNTSGVFKNYLRRDGIYRPYDACLWTFVSEQNNTFEFRFLKQDLGTAMSLEPLCSVEDVFCACKDNTDDTLIIDDTSKAALDALTLFNQTTLDANILKLPSITRRCGWQTPPMKFTTKTTTVYVLFWTGSLVAAQNHTGVSIAFRQVPRSCNETIQIVANADEGYEGIVKSSLFEGAYRPNENCKWFITGRQNRVIRLLLTHLDVNDCKNGTASVKENAGDSLRLYDVETDALPRLITEPICGSLGQLLTTSFATSGNQAIIEFRSDHVFEKGTGFVIAYKADAEGDNLPCNYLTIVSNVSIEGVIGNAERQTDGFYRVNEDCSWLIKADVGSRLQIGFQFIDIDDCGSEYLCPCDYIAIFDGQDKSNLIGKLCGNPENTPQFLSTGSEILISFVTDSTLSPYKGFLLSYQQVSVDSPSPSYDDNVIIIVSVIGSLVVISIASLIAAIVYRRRRPTTNKMEETKAVIDLYNYIAPACNFEDLLSQTGNEQIAKQLSQISITPEALQVDEVVLGEGNFGLVKSGSLDHSSTGLIKVAVKIVKGQAAPEILVDFVMEAIVMAPFNHPNVMKCLGVALVNQLPHIIFPLMANGCLNTLLRNSERSTCQLVDFCAQIASGMSYIAKAGFVHRDLACRNVLVDEFFVVKVADFGLARQLQDSKNYYRAEKSKIIPIKYHPPESLLSNLFELKSDVWSFGVVMWEIFTHCRQELYPGIDATDMVSYVTGGGRLMQPSNCDDEMYEVMQCCWNIDRTERPPFDQLSTLFDKWKMNNETF